MRFFFVMALLCSIVPFLISCSKNGDKEGEGNARLSSASNSNAKSMGVATMLSDGTIVYTIRGDAIHSDLKSVVWKYSVGSTGYSWALQNVGGIKSGETKPIPIAPPSVGSATMLQDGTIRMQTWSRGASGTIFEGVITIRPGDSRYQDVLKHLGGLNPGQVKGIPPGLDSNDLSENHKERLLGTASSSSVK
jgi:hypothetical protein